MGDNIGGVLFEDAGNVYSRFRRSLSVEPTESAGFDYMVHAVGFGVRYKTPIGPVRVDLAYTINPPSFVGFKGTINDLLTCTPTKPGQPATNPCKTVQQNTGHFQFFFSIGQTF